MSTRINVMFPDELLEDLRSHVPEGDRSAFIAQATRDKLRRERQDRAFDAAFGLWNDPSQERLDTEEGIREYLDDLRRPGEERLKRLDELT